MVIHFLFSLFGVRRQILHFVSRQLWASVQVWSRWPRQTTRGLWGVEESPEAGMEAEANQSLTAFSQMANS